METELVQLAREAVAALQAGPPPNWAEIAAVTVSGFVGFGQIGLIGWGLRQMSRNGDRRDQQLDAMTKALERQGEVLAELLRRSDTAN